jgi:hypothetical protein
LLLQRLVGMCQASPRLAAACLLPWLLLLLLLLLHLMLLPLRQQRALRTHVHPSARHLAPSRTARLSANFELLPLLLLLRLLLLLLLCLLLLRLLLLLLRLLLLLLRRLLLLPRPLSRLPPLLPVGRRQPLLVAVALACVQDERPGPWQEMASMPADRAPRGAWAGIKASAGKAGRRKPL